MLIEKKIQGNTNAELKTNLDGMRIQGRSMSEVSRKNKIMLFSLWLLNMISKLNDFQCLDFNR